MDPLNTQSNTPDVKPEPSKHLNLIFLGIITIIFVFGGTIATAFWWNQSSQETSFNLEGLDANKNGIRDDVEEYILNTYSSKKVQMALFQEAKAIQSALIHSNNPDVYKQDVKDSIRAVDCIYYVDKTNAYKMNAEIEAKMGNTPERFKAWLKVQNNVQVFTEISIGSTKSQCDFDPDLISDSSNAMATSTWKTYTNSQYGFEFKYPNKWSGSASLESNFIYATFDFVTKDGHHASLSIIDDIGRMKYFNPTSTPPKPENRTIEQLKPNHDETFKNIPIGNDNGIEISSGGCDSDPLTNIQTCTATFEYLSNTLYKKGISVILQVGDIKPEEVSQKAVFDPFPFIGDDINTAREILSTFKFTAPNTKSVGTLSGIVTIGPNCPVERADAPCNPTPEAYAAREFIVWRVLKQGEEKYTSFHANSDGHYNLSLPTDTYEIVSAKTGIGFISKDLPTTVTISAGETTTLNIDIDTGIR